MEEVYIIEMITGYDYDRTYDRLRVVSSYEKAVDYISIEYPDFIQLGEDEWVSEEPVTDETIRIYISMETVF